MAELVIVHIVEVRQLRQRGPLLHQVPAARILANRLQDDLGGESWEIHALGSDKRDGFSCPSHVLGPHSGYRLHPAFRIHRPALRSRPADGFPVYGKTITLIYMHSRIGNMFQPTRAKPRRTPWHLGFVPCNAAKRRHHLRRMSMHRTRDRARWRGASRTDNLLDPAAPTLKKFEKRSILRHPSNSRGYTPLQMAHGTGSEMVGDGFKALSGPTLRQGGRREGGRNG